MSTQPNQGLGCVLMKRGKVENATAEMLRGLDQLMERKEDRGTDKTYYDLRDMYGGHYLADTNLHVHLEEIKVDKTLRFVEEPVEIIDREVKSLKHSRIPIVKSIGTRRELLSCYLYLVRASEVVSSGFLIVKVRRDSKRGPKFTWERADHMKAKYSRLFVDDDVEPIIIMWLCDSMRVGYQSMERDRLLVIEVMIAMVAIICYVLHVYVVAKFFAYFVGKILGGDQLLVILCGYGTKSLELGTSFLSMTMFVVLDQGTRSVSIVILSFMNASIYASLIHKKFCWETIFPIGLKRYRDPKEEPIKKEPLMELKEIGYYRRFNENSSKVAKPFASLTQKIQKLCTHAKGKVENATAEMLCGMDQLIKRKEDGSVDRLRTWWKIYFTALVDIAVGVENTVVGLIILKRTDKKYFTDTNLHVHLEEIKVDKTLRFVEEPVEIINREVKSLKRSRILIVKSIGTQSEVMRIS
ncbi:hypothetical protein Tco_0073004 [Tanacetum coccineum]